MLQVNSFWVDVLDAGSGNRRGAGPLRAYRYRQTTSLDAVGEFDFDVPITDPNLAVLAEKQIVICHYLDHANYQSNFGMGIIDKIRVTHAQDGRIVLHVTGNDQGRELSYRSVGQLSLAGVAGAGVLNGPALAMAYAPSGWSLDAQDTQTNVYAGFDGESVLTALNKIGGRIGEHWRVERGQRVLTWLGRGTDFTDSGMYAAQRIYDPIGAETSSSLCVITSIDEERDATEICTRIIPRGSGNGSTIVTLANATQTPPSGFSLVDNTLINVTLESGSYGRIERVIDFKEIGPLSNTTADIQAAANMLLAAATEYLRSHAEAQKYYRLKLANMPKLPQVGTTLRVLANWTVDGVTVYDLDGIYNIVETNIEIGEQGKLSYDVLISSAERKPVSDADLLAGQIMDAKVLSAHQQLGASTDTLTWRDEMDDGHGASLRFWLGNEYTSIQRAIFRFRIQPLRSTVKSVGGESTSTSSGGGGTSTSASGGGQTADGGAHGHNCPVTGGISPDGALGFVVSGDFVGLVSSRSGDDGKLFQVGVTDSHEHTIAAHTHSVTIPDHTHDVTAEVMMEYGIFEESSANTLELEDLEIRLNSGANLLEYVEEIGSGWYALELSEYGLIDRVFRPAQENNELSIATSIEKTARIEAQLTIRGVVQAINYQS